MRTVIVYESLYGNTRTIAERIAAGITTGEVTLVPVRDATADLLAAADLLVVGAPTHVHGLPRPTSRQGAVDQADPERGLVVVEPHPTDPGVREWLADLDRPSQAMAAAFDTRVEMPVVLSGRASKVIAHRLRRRGWRLLVPPESFLVDRQTRLIAGEADRATRWGAELQRQMEASAQPAR